MKEEENAIQNIFLAYRREGKRNITEEEISQYIRSVDFLENLLRFSQTAFIIVEFKTWSYLYCSSNSDEILGHSAEDMMAGGPVFGLKRLHPEDLIVQGKIHPMMVDFFLTLPPDERERYKFSFTSRLMHKDGREVTLLQHNFFLKWDESGNPLIKLITFTDITPYKKNNDLVLYATYMPPQGKSEVVMQKNFSDTRDISLSDRELEILNHVALGFSAKEIGEQMSLAESTIKNHKKNIMKKMGCGNKAEMISLATLYGLVSTNNFTGIKT